ncbi:glycosyltransferase family 4 protein [Candidatus Uhrbacteria bacterium]|nr:glycosyltransferase family 4 protein [Candidatus Uhrbacteria bacterium]
MRIALTLLSGVGYGGQTYFRNLLPALLATDRHNAYHCFVQEAHPLIRELAAPNLFFHAVLRSRATAMERFHFEQIQLPRHLRRIKADLLYTAKNLTVFRAPCAQMIAIRNMEPFRYRAFANTWSHRAQSRLRWELTKRSLARADAIICVSRAVRDAVTEIFPAAEQKIQVIYNGNPVHHTERTPIPQPFLLTASKFVPYANQLTLVEAYGQLVAARPNTPPLWFAGGVHDARYFRRVQQRVTELQLTNHIRFLGLVSQAQLHALMRDARAFLFPSMVEACPHTLIEAMGCGAPIATTTVPPMPEICADAAIYCDPRDALGMATTIARLLDEDQLRAQLVAAGKIQAATFTWDRTARALVAAFTAYSAPAHRMVHG